MSNFETRNWLGTHRVVFTGDKPETDEEALTLSVEKWEFIVAALSAEGSSGDLIDNGWHTCGLCMYHGDWVPRDGSVNCENCPVGIYTGDNYCSGTPYHDYGDAIDTDDNKGALLAAATREVAFLKKVQAWWLSRDKEAATDETEEAG